MKTRFVSTLVVLWTVAAAAACSQTPADTLLGHWQVPEGDVIEIYKKQDRFFGRIAKLAQPVDEDGDLWRDWLNPDETLQGRLIVGIDLLLDLVYDPRKERWHEGRLYYPEDGKTYRCSLRLLDDGRLKLTVYFGLFRASEIWIRLPSDAAASNENL
ncbi:MAG: DUF2147 domain-containing protein [Rhodothermales bacterium]